MRPEGQRDHDRGFRVGKAVNRFERIKRGLSIWVGSNPHHRMSDHIKSVLLSNDRTAILDAADDLYREGICLLELLMTHDEGQQEPGL